VGIDMKKIHRKILYDHVRKFIPKSKYSSWELPCLQCGHKPDDIDKRSWKIMVEYTCYALTLVFVLAVVGIVIMMIKDVV